MTSQNEKGRTSSEKKILSQHFLKKRWVFIYLLTMFFCERRVVLSKSTLKAALKNVLRWNFCFLG